MRVATILSFAALVAFTVMAQVSFKIAAGRLGVVAFDPAWVLAFLREPMVALIIAANLGALGSYLSLIRTAAIGPAFAAAHLSIVVVVIVSVVYFHETLNWVQALGCVAIAVGVGILGCTEDTSAAPKVADDAGTQ